MFNIIRVLLILGSIIAPVSARDLITHNGNVSIPEPKDWLYYNNKESDCPASYITITPKEKENSEGTTTICFSGSEPKTLKDESPKRMVEQFKAGRQTLKLFLSKSFIAHYYSVIFLREERQVYAMLTLTDYDNKPIAMKRKNEFIEIVKNLASKDSDPANVATNGSNK